MMKNKNLRERVFGKCKSFDRDSRLLKTSKRVGNGENP
jgi:hypothetical protein